MKNLLKVMAALLVVALPFVVASCGGDDEEKGPKTYNYSWSLLNTTLPGTPTVAQEEAAVEAKKTINALFAAEFTKRGFKVDASAQTFSIVTEEEVANWDGLAKRAVSTIKGTDALAVAVEALPDNAKIVVKRGNSVIVDEKLK